MVATACMASSTTTKAASQTSLPAAVTATSAFNCTHIHARTGGWGQSWLKREHSQELSTSPGRTLLANSSFVAARLWLFGMPAHTMCTQRQGGLSAAGTHSQDEPSQPNAQHVHRDKRQPCALHQSDLPAVTIVTPTTALLLIPLPSLRMVLNPRDHPKP